MPTNFSRLVESAREPLFPADFLGSAGKVRRSQFCHQLLSAPGGSDLEPLLTGNFVQVVNLKAMLQAYIYGQECWCASICCAFLEKNCDVFRSVSFVRCNRSPRDLQEENCQFIGETEIPNQLVVIGLSPSLSNAFFREHTDPLPVHEAGCGFLRHICGR